MSADDGEYDHLIKLLLLGDSAVGKSSLLLRFCDNKFEQNFVITIGVDFKIKNIVRGDKRVRLQVWDTAGQERFRTITPAYYRSAMGVIITYDVTDMNSFNNVEFWMENLAAHGEESVQRVLVGNKADLTEKRVVSRERGEELARKHGIQLFETSAKTATEVEAAFNHIADQVFVNRFGELTAPKRTTVDLNSKPATDKKKCSC